MRPGDPRRLRERVLEILDQSGMEAPIFLGLGDCVIEVSASTPALAGRLRRYYRELSIEPTGRPDIRVAALQTAPWEPRPGWRERAPDPGKSIVKEEYLDLPAGRLVRKRATGMLFFFEGSQNVALGPCVEHLNQVVSFVDHRYTEWLLDRGALLCHAAGVSLGGRGLAIAGSSGSGKSTLALHMMNRGLDFVSNDRLLLTRAGTGTVMRGVTKQPRVNPGTLLSNRALRGLLPVSRRRAYEAMDPDALRLVEDKHDVDLRDCFGPGRLTSSARLGALLLLDWKREAGRASIHPVDLASRRDLLRAAVKAPGLFFLGEPGSGDRDYVEVFRGSPVLRASGRVDFQAAVEACLPLLA